MHTCTRKHTHTHTHCQLAVHPLEVAGTLSVTVTSSIRGTSGVGWVHVASLLYLRKVYGRVDSANHVAHVNQGNLLLEHADPLVLLVNFHEVRAGADVDRSPT